jgi:CHAD domain-containing protein
MEKSSLKKLLNDALLDFNEESVHNFRIGIKKIKAKMQLIRRHDKSFDYKKKYPNIRRLYKNLGTVRELHVLEEKFNDSNKILQDSVKHKAQQILNQILIDRQYMVITSFDDAVYKSLKKAKRQVKKTLKEVSDKDFKKYFDAKTDKLVASFESLTFSKKQLHELRKLIKEIKFNMSFDPKRAEKILNNRGIDIATLDNLQKWLGDWLDNIFLKQKLIDWGSALNIQKDEKHALKLFLTVIDNANDRLINHVKDFSKISQSKTKHTLSSPKDTIRKVSASFYIV